ncbi:MAG: AAA family ATPase [Planctomycetaceae bacterium]
MLKITRIKINGFRRLVDVDLPLNPLCVMIGPNGVGKTSLLDVFSLLAASARGELETKIAEYEGLFSVLTRGVANQLNVEIECTLEQCSLIYCLVIERQEFAYQIRREFLRTSTSDETYFIDRMGSKEYRFDLDKKDNVNKKTEFSVTKPTETSLSQISPREAVADAFKKTIESALFMGNLFTGPRSQIRLPQRLRRTYLPGSQAEDLVSCLYTLRETSRDRFETLIATLQAAFPDFERIEFPPIFDGYIAADWKSKHFGQSLHAYELSEGTLRFLWLATLLLSPALSTVTMIDEPEVSLHPELMSLLVDLMRGASRHTQLIVATHSDRLIRFLKPEEVLIADMTDEGYAKFTWGSDLDLDEWLAEYSLDELWEMKRLGGVP